MSNFKRSIFLAIFLLSSQLIAEENCQKLVTTIIKASKITNKVSDVGVAAQGLVGEVGQRPKSLFINLSATGPGFDLAQKQVLEAFIANTPDAEIIIASTKNDFLSLAKYEPGKKETIDFLIAEEKAKNIKIKYLFKGKEFAIDSVLWTRDYAPIKIFNKKTKSYELIAFRYLKAEPKDATGAKNGIKYIDDIQQGIADTLNLKLKKSELVIEGGNMLSDSNGTVFMSTRILLNNASKSKEEIEKELIKLGLAERIIWLTQLPLELEPTGHVDLVVRVISAEKVIVPTSSNKKVNSALNKIAKEISSSGYQVERLQMSPEAVRVIDGSKSIQSHMNALQLQSTIVIPQYGSSFDQEAATFYQGLGLNVIFATGETMQAAGSVHCMTYTY